MIRNHNPATGVVLAAGFGTRLSANGNDTALKPLVKVAGCPLIIRAITSLESAGCDRVVVVLGYEPDIVRQTVERGYHGASEVIFVINSRFDLQNGVSVLAARQWVNGRFILVMADHVVDEVVMECAGLHVPRDKGATLLVDYKLATIFDMDDATKVAEEEGRVVSIGKQLDEFNCVDTGVFVCTDGLMAALQARFEKQGDVSLTEGVQDLADRGAMQTLDIGTGFWQDIDTPEMLAYAEHKLGRSQEVM